MKIKTDIFCEMYFETGVNNIIFVIIVLENFLDFYETCKNPPKGVKSIIIYEGLKYGP